ncbi:MAG: hypothetical protein LWX83_09545, partial [Anaerolineae bacterium]|nr:hypothetical protein [Anaerolineae bacterium]
MNEAIVKLLERHSAGFQFKHYQPGETAANAQTSYFAGWVVAIRGTWYFLTSGRAIAALQALKENSAVISDCFFDHQLNLGAKSAQAVPLAYKELTFFQIYNPQANINFGMILIPYGQRVLLDQHGIQPVNESIWDGIDHIDFEKKDFFLAGILNKRVGSGKHPLLVLSAEESEPSSGERFGGKILEPAAELKEGLNGGAIFGFNNSRDKYWMIALLSENPNEDGSFSGC